MVRPPIEGWQQKVNVYGAPIVTLTRDDWNALCQYALELERRALALCDACADLEGTPVQYNVAIPLAKAMNELRALLPQRGQGGK